LPAESDHLTAPLGEAEEEGEQSRAQEEPLGDLDGNHHEAGQRSQEEPGGDRHHVEQDHVLQHH
jgi:hypothetical protein